PERLPPMTISTPPAPAGPRPRRPRRMRDELRELTVRLHFLAVGPPGSLRRGVRDHARGRRTRRPGAAAAGADPGAVPRPGPRAAAAPRPPHIGSRAPRAEPRALRDPWPEPFG